MEVYSGSQSIPRQRELWYISKWKSAHCSTVCSVCMVPMSRQKFFKATLPSRQIGLSWHTSYREDRLQIVVRLATW